VNPAPHLFLDASVFIAAAGSMTGGSSLVLEICRHGKAKAKTSHLVLLEAERNIQAKLGSNALLRFYQEIVSIDTEVVKTPTQREISSQKRIIHPKDAHVLAAALKGNVNFLLTLDRKHFLSPKVTQARLPFQIMTPSDFLKLWVI
jgi:predicted nucleic acid-binding protein